MPRAWTLTEEARALALLNQGRTPVEIAHALDRGPTAVRGHFEGDPRWQTLTRRYAGVRRRLTFQYGPARAGRIMAERDPDTEADVAAWNRLGAR